MMDYHPVPMEYFLKPGYIVVHNAPAIVYFVTGSGVVVTLWDKLLHIGGLCNFQYPSLPNGGKPTARYGTVALPTLLKMLLESGATRENIVAQVFGGADRPGSDIGRKNAESARKWLAQMKLNVQKRQTGGDAGRKVMYNVITNEAVVMQARRVRQSDWYPYDDDRG